MCNTESKLLDQYYAAGRLQGRSNAGGPFMTVVGTNHVDFMGSLECSRRVICLRFRDKAD
jgi:hypothetical protein